MRDNSISRKFIVDVDRYNYNDFYSSAGGDLYYDEGYNVVYEGTEYHEGKRYCSGCRVQMGYNAKSNCLLCSKCGFIVDLNNEPEDSDYGGASTGHSNSRKKAFQDSDSTPAVIPLNKSRKEQVREQKPWANDISMLRAEDKGAKIVDYKVLVPREDDKSFIGREQQDSDNYNPRRNANGSSLLNSYRRRKQTQTQSTEENNTQPASFTEEWWVNYRRNKGEGE